MRQIRSMQMKMYMKSGMIAMCRMFMYDKNSVKPNLHGM